MNPPIATPISTSASSTLTAAMIQSGVIAPSICPPFLFWRSGRPAPSRRGAASQLAERTPSFVRRGTRLFDSPADAGDLAQKVIQLRLDLIANASAAFRQIQPAPYAPNYRACKGRCQHSRALVHVRLLDRASPYRWARR